MVAGDQGGAEDRYCCQFKHFLVQEGTLSQGEDGFLDNAIHALKEGVQ
jgi:hypothetical protein